MIINTIQAQKSTWAYLGFCYNSPKLKLTKMTKLSRQWATVQKAMDWELGLQFPYQFCLYIFFSFLVCVCTRARMCVHVHYLFTISSVDMSCIRNTVTFIFIYISCQVTHISWLILNLHAVIFTFCGILFYGFQQMHTITQPLSHYHIKQFY